MKFSNQIELEKKFANNFASPIFPILAKIYYDKKEYNRALKVCQIGLSYDSDNFLGQYILSETYLAMQKDIEAEKTLKFIIKNDAHNINALINLVYLEKKLNRSAKTIQKFINIGINQHINNSLFQKKTEDIHKKKSKKTNQLYLKPKKEKTPTNTVDINEKMATKTMYNLMMKQKKYDIAITILNVIEAKNKNKTFVKAEKKKINNFIKKRN